MFLYADEFVVDLRINQRGSTQDEKFVTATATRSFNLLEDMRKFGVDDTTVDTGKPEMWERGLDIVTEHLGF